MDRLELLENWLQPQIPGAPYTLAPASADASFRRYFRVSLPDRSLIVMDAPPEHEDCRPFIHVAELFRDAGVRVPQILAQDLQQGFLLLTDLGGTTYLDALKLNEKDEAAADTLYAAAAGALINIQLASRPAVLPDYDEALLLREMRLFPDWYVSKRLRTELSSAQAEALDGVFTQILRNNLAQPKVFVHRDYHSRNLMVSGSEPGILDFQDAVYGPITYDLVSLFKDAYIHWEEERVLDWTIRYWERAKKAGLPVSRDFAEFYRDFEWMGAQRHIKVLGIFARLCHRDGKENYLKDMPLVMAYLRKVCERYRELHPLLKLLDELEEKQKAVLSPELKVLSPASRFATVFTQDSGLRTTNSGLAMKAMILAAGRGERMRPLTDVTPKPLLEAGGKPLIVWHIEKLARAGFTELVINYAHLGEKIEAALGDGSRFGVSIRYAPEIEALETAGGIANALPQLGPEPFLVVNGDIFCDYDFTTLPRELGEFSAWLVLVDNPDQHPDGDFALRQGKVLDEGEHKLTFSGIGIYRPELFAAIARGTKARLAPLLREQMAVGRVGGEHHRGLWLDVGTPQRLQELDQMLQNKTQGCRLG